MMSYNRKSHSGSVAVPKRFMIYECNGEWLVSANKPGAKVFHFKSKEEADNKVKELS
jgi:hypothetical protein